MNGKDLGALAAKLIDVLGSHSLSPHTSYLLVISTWKLNSLGKVPSILNYDEKGLEGLRIGNADGLETDPKYYGYLICCVSSLNEIVAF